MERRHGQLTSLRGAESKRQRSLLHGLDQIKPIRRAAARQRRDSVELFIVFDPQALSHCQSQRAGNSAISRIKLYGCDKAGHALTDQRRRIGHRPHQAGALK
ncbi:hypothetical protein CSC30_3543 [Pseudomonas aeruginosa]|nr:hypothetical protein CSC30_3543 [Pseudomonas aeruginosa]